MAVSAQGNNGSEMSALEITVSTLADVVGKLTTHKTAPEEQFKKSQEMTVNLEYQTRCLKRERVPPVRKGCDSSNEFIGRAAGQRQGYDGRN